MKQTGAQEWGYQAKGMKRGRCQAGVGRARDDCIQTKLLELHKGDYGIL
jgi:hypothetical protein